MKRAQNSSTPQQFAYATRLLGGQGTSRKEIALLSGYSPGVANNVGKKIESTEGFRNAIQKLAFESNNMLIATLQEFKSRGLKSFTNKDLNAALNAISSAWDRIEKTRAPNRMQDAKTNPLRGVFQRRVETHTVAFEETPETPVHAEATVVEVSQLPVGEKEDPLDF